MTARKLPVEVLVQAHAAAIAEGNRAAAAARRALMAAEAEIRRGAKLWRP